MSQVLDRIIEEVRQLPPGERERLRELLNREAHTVSSFAPSHGSQDERSRIIESIRGKYAYVQTSSDDFNRRKQAEIELEDRRR